MQPQNPVILDPFNIPQLALESKNKVHREEVVLINQLATLLQQAKHQQADNAAISEKLDEWVQHTREHFASEERLMVKYGFPAYVIHGGEHQRVMAQIQSLQNQWLDRKELESLYEFVFGDWAGWFNDHVNSMDRVTAEFINQRIK